MVNKKNSGIELKGVLDSLQDDSTIKETNHENNIDTGKETKQQSNTSMNTISDIKNNTTKKFIIKKKVDDKKGKKAFNVYMVDYLVKELDKVSKKSGYSRNELINMMCEYCINNLELVEE